MDHQKSFVRISALNILIIYSIVEVQFANLSYNVIPVWDIIKYPILRIPYNPWTSISFVSFGWFPTFVELLLVLSMMALILFPINQGARVLALLALTVKLLSSHLGTGVHLTTFYLVPFIFLAFFPNKNGSEHATLRRLVIAFACMYFFSALFKLNPHYLSGNVLKYDSLVRSSTKEFFHKFTLFPVITATGIILEFLGSLLVFGRFRKLALLSAFTFHLGVALAITWSFRLQATSASLLLLFLPQDKVKPYFNWLCILLVSHAASHYVLYLAALKWFPQYNHLSQDVHGIAFGLVIYFVSIYFLFKSKVDISDQFSLKLIVIPVIYAVLAFYYRWPEPFGYTQYSGLKRPFYAVSIDNDWGRKQREILKLKGRWSFKIIHDLFTNETTYLFPHEQTRKKFENYICQLDPNLIYIRMETDKMINLETNDPDREGPRESLTASRVSVNCQSADQDQKKDEI